MKNVEQYIKMLELKKAIDEDLSHLNFDNIRRMIRWMKASEEFQKLKSKDNQLSYFEFFLIVWLKENSEKTLFEMQGDIFYGIKSLEDVEKKYLTARFLIYRLENNMPYESCITEVKKILEYKFSGYALYTIILRESLEIENNIIKLARIMKEQNELIKAIGLLQLGVQKYPEHEDLILELVDIWLMTQQWKQARECLLNISNANDEIKEMIVELEKMV